MIYIRKFSFKSEFYFKSDHVTNLNFTLIKEEQVFL